MAARTLGFVFGVPGYQLTGHEQGLDFSRIRSFDHQQAHGE
jgi:hypothetical protein